jgi:hypothetical protein
MTVHLVSGTDEFCEWGLLLGTAVGFHGRIVGYVMTTATNDGLLESKLMWQHGKV